MQISEIKCTMPEKIDTTNQRDDHADIEILSKQDKQVINEYLNSL